MAATLLAVDAGSSSVRLSAFVLAPSGGHASASPMSEMAAARTAFPRLASERFEASAEDQSTGFNAMLDSFIRQHGLRDVEAVVHRVVHGGVGLTSSCVITRKVEAELSALTDLAPLHMPSALAWVDLCRSKFGDGVAQIAVFDTAFFAVLPDVARYYAIPRSVGISHGLRRFGFHGLAHESMLIQAQHIRPDLDHGGRLISIQLGGGCSIAAIMRGIPCDTSMGFSPLEGLMMATRSGDIDPGLLFYLQEKSGMTADRLARLLNFESGLLGVSGISGDMRKLLDSPASDATLAIELYCYRVRKYIGAFAAVLGGVDLVVFGGGVGENCPKIREKILDGMEWCGISIDPDRNKVSRDGDGTEGAIGKSGSPVDVRVAKVDESVILVREAIKVLTE